VAVDLAALKTELLTDVNTYGYAAYIAANEPENCAAALNKVRNGTDGEAAINIRRADIAPSELSEAIDIRDLDGTPTGTDPQALGLIAAWYQSTLLIPRIRLTNANGNDTLIKRNLDRLLGDANGTQTRLNALAVRFGSRSEQLFGVDTVVSTSDVVAALALP
jgi:hypothetical protein